MDKKYIKDIIDADLYRVYGARGKKELIKTIFNNPGFRYVYIMRKCQYYKEKSKVIFIFYYVLLKHYQYKYGIQMSYKTQVGKGFYFGGINSITVNKDTKIGENVNILKGVLLGYNPRGEKKGCPIIGNKVWVGPNSIIVGNVKIGNEVIIAPGAFVNFDVPDNSIVIGNPGKIISKENTVDKYINFLYK